MEMLLTLTTIVQTIAISLGVGSSTLAIVNFFAAIADGTIDETERRMMGIVYIVLRVAMVLILVTTIVLIAASSDGLSLQALSGHVWAQLLVLLMLFGNAILMTAHLMPTTFGPALQAGSWYTLGVLAALERLTLTDYALWQFSLAYVTGLVFAVGLVNGIMAALKART